MGWLWLGRRAPLLYLWPGGASSSPPELKLEPRRLLARLSAFRAAASSSGSRRSVACRPSWCIFRLTAALGSPGVELVPVVPVVVVLPPSVAFAPAVGAALAPLLSCDIDADAEEPVLSGRAKRVREPCREERVGLMTSSLRRIDEDDAAVVAAAVAGAM